MSRIILDRYDDGSTHVVVGWDHPAGGAFWQEWATKQEIDDAEKELEKMTGEYPADLEVLFETGVKREGGMWPGIPLDIFVSSVPEDLQHLMTPEVMTLLYKHAEGINSGYVGTSNRGITDLTKK